MLTLALRAAFLDSKAYQEIGEEQGSLLRPLAIVLAAAVALGLGIRAIPAQESAAAPAWVNAIGEQNVVMLAWMSIVLMSWALWASVAYIIGTRILGGKASYRLMLKALGFAYAPGVLMVLVAIPNAGDRIFTVILFWLLATGSVAVRSVQGFGWLKAFVPSMLGWMLGLWFLPGNLFQVI